MLGIVLLVLIASTVVFYQCYAKLIQLDLRVASLDTQITEKLDQLKVKKILIAEKEKEIVSLDAQIIEKQHELRVKQLEIEVINLKPAELEKRCHIEKVR